jgi:hypothetical protein
MKNIFLLLLPFCGVCLLSACGSGGSAPPPSSRPAIKTTQPQLTAAPAVAGTSYDFTFQATGTGTLTWSAVGLPSDHLSLDPATGIVSGTPASEANVLFTLTVTDTSGHSSPATQFTITVNNPSPPSITTTQAQLAATSPEVGNSYSFSFTATGGLAPLTWTQSGPLPTGLLFNTGGVLSGMPTVTGSFPISVIVQDSLGQNSGSQGFTVNVTSAAATNPVPLINQPLSPDASIPGGGDFNLTVNGTGFAPGALVNWNGTGRATKFVSNSSLTATVLAADIANFNTASVAVVNPAPGGGTSNVVSVETTRPTSSVALTDTSQFAVGSSPRLVAAGDFNRDGHQDLVVADNINNDVGVLIGNGDATFRPAMHFATGTFPFSAVTADFNGDGNLDLVVTNSASNNVSILLGNGDGSFQPAVNYGTGMNPASVAVGDFNVDGKLDLAVANTGSNDVSILLGNGNGTFQPAVNFGAGQQPQYLAVGDFNSDNKLDLAAANIGGDNVSVLLGNGDGTFQAPVDYPVGTEPISLVAGDFNGDGKLDLATANLGSDDVSVLLGNGDGTFQAGVSYGAGSGPSSLVLGDFNGDGKLDLAVPNRSSSNVSLLLGNSDGTFQPAVDFAASQRPDSLAVGDFNGDGRPDLAVGDSTGSTVSILLQPGLVTGPNAILSAANLTFPTQLLGTTSSAQTVTMINNGTQTLNISNISATSRFEETNTCASSLAAGASCSIGVTFTPGAIDLVTGTLSITDNGPGSPQTVVLDGTGTTVNLDPAGMKFICNTHLPGGCQLKPRTATLTNTGSTTLTITSIKIDGFFSETNTCPASLGAGLSCTITVTAIGGPLFSSGNVLVNDNGGGSPQRIALTFYEF